MSSIFGKWNLTGQSISPEELNLMTEKLSYWEVDDQGTWLENSIAFGHLMLHNTPESFHEKLPYVDKQAMLSITSDARIDNRDELFRQLEIPKQQQSAMPDSQLILKAYQKWGVDCLEFLHGVFAFAIWDSKNQQVFCARDRIGIKPLFFHYNPNYFAFSSEIKGLLCLPNFPKKVNTHFLKRLCVGFWADEDTTFFDAIKSLSPAHYLIINKEELQIKKYWKPNPHKTIKLSSDDEYMEAFNEKLHHAITSRVRTNFPVGSQLSGGLDSSGISALAYQYAKQKNIPFYTYSNVLGPEDKRNVSDEFDKIKQVLDYTGMPNHQMKASHHRFLDEVDHTLHIRSHPNQINLFQNSDRIGAQAAKHNVRTMLSGHTGDEVVSTNCAGYLQLYFMQFKWKALWNELVFRGSNPYKGFAYKALELFHHKLPQKYKSVSTSKIENRLSKSLFNVAIIEKWKGDFIEQFKETKYRAPFSNELLATRILNPAMSTRMGIEYLASKFHKIEPSYPMSDVRLIEFTMATPLNQKVTLGEGRWLYRRALEGLIPESIRNQFKRSTFSNVIPYELAHRLADFDRVEALLLKARNDKRFDFMNLDLVIANWRNNKANNNGVGFTSLSLALEFIRFIEQEPAYEDLIKEALADLH